MIELEKTIEVKFESINFLEEHITDWIWSSVYEHFEELPKNAKIQISLKFFPND